MQQPHKAHAARKRQEGEHMVREQHPADHQPQHGGQHQQVQDQLQDAGRGVPPFGQAAPPPGVEDVVGEEEQEGPGAHPLMGNVPPVGVAHQKQQGQRHEGVQGDLALCFGDHGGPHRPSPATHSAT